MVILLVIFYLKNQQFHLIVQKNKWQFVVAVLLLNLLGSEL